MPEFYSWTPSLRADGKMVSNGMIDRKWLIPCCVLLAACGGNKLRSNWFVQVTAVVRVAQDDSARAVGEYLRLVEAAPVAEDRCLALSYAAGEAVRIEPEQARLLWTRVLDDRACREIHDKALFNLADLKAGQGPLAEAVPLFSRAITRFPAGYWARRALERLWELDEQLYAEGQLSGPLYLSLYDSLKYTNLAGHLLYYTALWHRRHAGRELALYHLVLLVDYHSTSSLWDEAVWMTADLLSEAGYVGDETAILEEALVPHPGRGIDSLTSGFVQKVRHRLALLYERQGRYDEALYQLRLVVNVHSPLQLKDDALWIMGRIYATLGDVEREHKALAFLVENCPWSRWTAEARERLGIGN